VIPSVWHGLPSAFGLAPLLLAVTLLWSAAFKFADRESTRSAIRQLRLPRALAGSAFAIALPAAEIALAAGLLAPWADAYLVSACAAALLFAAYLAVIARALTFDPRPRCGCFGRMGNSQVSPVTLARNIVLVAVALGALAVGLGGRTAWSTLEQGGADSGWWVLAAAVASCLAALIVSRPAESAAAAPTGPAERTAIDEGESGAADEGADPEDYIRTRIPRATLQADDGSLCSLRELASERAQVLVAVNCTCGPTVRAADRLKAWQAMAPAVDVRFVSTVNPPAIRRIAQVDEILYDHDEAAWHALRIDASPAAVLLGADGELAGGPVHGLDEIEQFMAAIAAALADPGREADARGTAE